MSETLRCAVVGVGYLGRFHAEKYTKIEGCELVAVCDLDIEKLQPVADELKTQAVSDFRELIGRVDAVTIAATTTAHYKLAKFFLENGIHVHVEKPMTSTSVEGEELCVIAEQRNLVLQVGHVERFNPALLSAQEKLGKPLFIECHRLAPFKSRGVDVDVVLDLMIHDIDVVLSLVDSDPVKVSAIGTPVMTKTTDIANARIEFASGTVANITSSRVSQGSQRKFRVFQQDQYLSIDFHSGEVSLLTKTGDFTEGEFPVEIDRWSLEKSDALLEETKSFVEAIRLSRAPVVSGRDGLRALKLAEKVMAEIQKRH